MLITSIIILSVLYMIGKILYNNHPENHRIKFVYNILFIIIVFTLTRLLYLYYH